MTTSKQPKMPEAGPVGRQVAASVDQLREVRGWSWRRLSAELERVGRPVLPLGFTRMMRGDRRTDVDDAVALAVVLGVNPNALLFPRDRGWDDMVELAPAVRASAFDVWQWARSVAPLPVPAGEDGAPYDRAADFTFHSLPHPAGASVRSDPALEAAVNLAGRVQAALREQGSPEDWEGRKAWLRRSYEMAGLALEDMLARGDDAARKPAG